MDEQGSSGPRYLGQTTGDWAINPNQLDGVRNTVYLKVKRRRLADFDIHRLRRCYVQYRSTKRASVIENNTTASMRLIASGTNVQQKSAYRIPLPGRPK